MSEQLNYVEEPETNITEEEVNETQEERFTSKPFKKRKMFTPEYYVCIADGRDSFYAVLESMREVCKQFNKFVTPIYQEIADETGYYNIDAMYEGMSKYLVENYMPKLLTKKNIRTSLNVTANKIKIRLESVAFGFEVSYHIEDSQAIIDSCTGTVVMYSNNADLRNSIMKNGNWERVFR